ncbi:hypothetical protein [Methanoplanus endosymbiosus]|uniref:Uncharacterized protein n=1 Tax=Methanoplanus endosymbiosus TaxID=33865 RepID=A0A9E7PLZ5_9EURY|nr:hypothetical protein [Methanoplanus endosymbiosus]UUX91787.1 hypothetical protein L6E24_10490 [Methanoplanus endosymbiosus]
MNILELLQYISSLKKGNLYVSRHFKIRYEERKDSLMPEIDDFCNLLNIAVPVEISQQDLQKFKVIYNLNEEYDLVLIISVKWINSEIIINLITCYRQSTGKRVRKDE